MKPHAMSRYLTLAKKESEKSSFKRFRVGAVLVRKGRVISKGYNRNKSHSLGSGFAKTLHAEGSTLQDALKQGINPAGAIMYVFRKGGNLSKPCMDCQRHLINFGVNTVIYTDNNEEVRLEL